MTYGAKQLMRWRITNEASDLLRVPGECLRHGLGRGGNVSITTNTQIGAFRVHFRRNEFEYSEGFMLMPGIETHILLSIVDSSVEAGLNDIYTLWMAGCSL